jgi:hypothetical protein
MHGPINLKKNEKGYFQNQCDNTSSYAIDTILFSDQHVQLEGEKT